MSPPGQTTCRLSNSGIPLRSAASTLTDSVTQAVGHPAHRPISRTSTDLPLSPTTSISPPSAWRYGLTRPRTTSTCSRVITNHSNSTPGSWTTTRLRPRLALRRDVRSVQTQAFISRRAPTRGWARAGTIVVRCQRRDNPTVPVPKWGNPRYQTVTRCQMRSVSCGVEHDAAAGCVAAWLDDRSRVPRAPVSRRPSECQPHVCRTPPARSRLCAPA